MLRRILLGGLLLAALVSMGSSRPERERTYRKLDIFAKVLNYIQTHHVESIPPEELLDAAIEGMVARLDAHSDFLTSEEYRTIRDELAPPPVGIGVLLQPSPSASGVMVQAVLTESPADRAGLIEGDRLLRIDGAPAELPTAAMARLSGEVGSYVELEVQRGAELLQRRVPRARLRPFLVRGRRVRGGFAVVQVDRFTLETSIDLERTLRTLSQPGPLKGVVLDLRGNAGGLVESAARVADFWLDSGIIVTTEARGRVLEKYVAHRYATEPSYPLVVLVDGKTASAAEIVAVALQESGRAQVVGTRTFGKGTVQTLIELEDGSALKLTVARHHTPSHESVQGVGVQPDVPLPAEVRSPAPGATERPDPGLALALQTLEARRR